MRLEIVYLFQNATGIQPIRRFKFLSSGFLSMKKTSAGGLRCTQKISAGAQIQGKTVETLWEKIVFDISV